jgi:AraC-like DNA-binding protein
MVHAPADDWAPVALSLAALREQPFLRPLVLGAGEDRLQSDRGFHRRRLPYAEVWWMLEGVGEFGVGEEFFSVSSGDLVLHQPFQAQSAIPAPTGFLRYLWIHFDVVAPDPPPAWRQQEWDSRVEVAPLATRWRYVSVETPSRLRPRRGEEFHELFLRIVTAFRAGEAGSAQASTLCHQLLLAVADEQTPLALPTPAAAQRAAIRQVLAHMHRHLSRSLTLAELGQVACLHPVYLGTLFKRQTGLSPMEYLTQRRIEAAQELLRNQPEQSVASIAAEVGFGSLPHFHRVFRRLTGATPHQFRQTEDHDRHR